MLLSSLAIVVSLLSSPALASDCSDEVTTMTTTINVVATTTANSATPTGNATVAGNATMAGSAAVAGNATFAGNATLAGNLSGDGNLTAAANSIGRNASEADGYDHYYDHPPAGWTAQPLSAAPQGQNGTTGIIAFGDYTHKCLTIGNAWPARPAPLGNCSDDAKATWHTVTNANNKTLIYVKDQYVCLDAGNAPTNGTKLSFDNCKPERAKSQEWDISVTGRIKLAGTDLCMDLPGGKLQNDNPVHLRTCVPGNPNQVWTVAGPYKAASKSTPGNLNGTMPNSNSTAGNSNSTASNSNPTTTPIASMTPLSPSTATPAASSASSASSSTSTGSPQPTKAQRRSRA